MIPTTKKNAAILAVVIAASTANQLLICEGFHQIMPTSSKTFTNGAQGFPYRIPMNLPLQKGWLDNENEDEDGLVTREDLNREMLGMEPKVKRKNRKGKGYKPLDNRDHLPFSVRTKTPDDPYKNRFQKKKEEQLQKNKKGFPSKKTDLDRHMLATTKRGIDANAIKDKTNKNNNSHVKNDSTTPSRLVQRRSKKTNGNDNSKSLTTVIGEFELDKSTTSGDVIVLGDKEYRVETARCQYKYAGGQRFVMVRKILEVKELTRVQNEEALLRQFKSSPSSSSALSDDLE